MLSLITHGVIGKREGVVSVSQESGHTPPDPIEFTGCRPVLQVRDLRVSLPYYVDKLGFTDDWEVLARVLDPAERERPTFCHVFCSCFELFLREVERPRPGEIVIGCASPALVDRAHREYLRRGAVIEEEPRARPWGTYEMLVKDPDGNLLRIVH